MPHRSYDIWRMFANNGDRRFAHHLKILSALGLAGVVWALGMLAVELLLVDPILQQPAQVLYRMGFWLSFPSRLVLHPFFRPQYPTSAHLIYTVLCSVTAPAVICGGYRLLRKLTRRAERHSGSGEAINRRAFLGKAASGTVLVCGAGIGIEGSLLAPQRLATKRYDIPVQDLPDALDGLRIVHISDTHYGRYITLPFLEGVVAQANQLQPDLVLLTGDYVHKHSREIEDGIAIFRNLESRLGCAGVLGNHDHWTNAAKCRAAFAEFGLPLLDNRQLFLSPRGLSENIEDPESMCVGGVGDLWTDAVRPDLALENVPTQMPRLLLSHNPDAAELPEFQTHRIDLMLAGHTHGGQVALPLIGSPMVPSRFGQKYAGGLVMSPAGRVIVSRGVGMALFPVRLGVPPEIGLITLKKA